MVIQALRLLFTGKGDREPDANRGLTLVELILGIAFVCSPWIRIPNVWEEDKAPTIVKIVGLSVGLFLIIQAMWELAFRESIVKAIERSKRSRAQTPRGRGQIVNPNVKPSVTPGTIKGLIEEAESKAYSKAAKGALTDTEVEMLFNAYAKDCSLRSRAAKNGRVWVTYYEWSNDNGGQLRARYASTSTPDWSAKQMGWLGVGQAGPGKLAARARAAIHNCREDVKPSELPIPVVMLADDDLRGKELEEDQAEIFCDTNHRTMFSIAVFPFEKRHRTWGEIELEDGRYFLGALNFCFTLSEEESGLGDQECKDALIDCSRVLGHLLALHIGVDNLERFSKHWEIRRVAVRRHVRIPSREPQNRDSKQPETVVERENARSKAKGGASDVKRD